jgi:hypothetical protein
MVTDLSDTDLQKTLKEKVDRLIGFWEDIPTDLPVDNLKRVSNLLPNRSGLDVTVFSHSLDYYVRTFRTEHGKDASYSTCIYLSGRDKRENGLLLNARVSSRHEECLASHFGAIDKLARLGY